MLGASFTVLFFGGPDLAIAGQETSKLFTGLRKDQAEAVYRVCQHRIKPGEKNGAYAN